MDIYLAARDMAIKTWRVCCASSTISGKSKRNIFHRRGHRNHRSRYLTFPPPERRLISSTNALNKTTYRYYDADGQLIRSAAPNGAKWLVGCQSYTPSGKLLKTWGPAETILNTTCPTPAAPTPVTDFSYDDLDRPIRTTQNLLAGEGGNRISETVYFPDGKPQRINRGVGTPLQQTAATYSYTPNGQLATLTDAKGNLTRYLYNGHDRLITTQYPNPSVPGSFNSADQEQLSYDANGNVLSLIKRNGQSLSFVYDNLNRLINRNYPNSAINISFGYDLLSHRTVARYNNGSYDINTVYDNAGRLTSTAAAGRTLTYQYDPAGNRTRLTWPDGYSISTDYDALNRPLSLKEGGTVPLATLATYAWDDLSRRSTLSLGNNTVSTNSYNPQGSLASLTHNLAGTTNDLGFSYVRNQSGEIITINPTNSQSNWMLANPPQNRSANGLNQYTAINSNAITHDANGNLQSDGLWTYGHDLDNRLVSAVRNNPASGVSLSYDPAGRLNRTVVDNQTTDLLYDGSDLIAEYDGAGNLTTRHIHGPGVDAPLVSITGTTKTWRYADHLGSVIAEADAGGNAVAIRGYGPFGENGGTIPNRFGYTGQQYIAGLGLYYYKARWYSPTMGRFLETVPIGYGDGVNWYAYVGNNPVNANDPSGQLAFFWHFGITYVAARDSGMDILDSAKLAWNTMMVDKGTQGVTPADANQHAMLGQIGKNPDGSPIYETPDQALIGINAIKEFGTLSGALHVTQDEATPLHYLQPWEGGGFNFDTLVHLWHDTFPSLETVKNAYTNSKQVLNRK